MKKTLTYLLASLVVVFVAMPAFAEIEWSGNIMTGIEKMDYGTATVPSDKESDETQFSNIKLNLDVKADVCDGVVGVAQLRSVCTDCKVFKRCIYVEITDLLIPDGSIQIGRVQLPLGAELAKASEGANTMNNPLIFNSLLADNMEDLCVDDGLLITKVFESVTCKLGITNGCDSEEIGGLQPACKDTNSDKAMTLNFSGDCPAVEGLSLAGTYYTNDMADVTGATDEVTAWIVDVAYKTGLWKLAAALANVEGKYDETYNSEKTVETADIDYLVLEMVYGNGETPWWVAVRQSEQDSSFSINPAISDITVKGIKQKRLELGVGYKLCDNAYLKAEYIKTELKDDKDNLNDKDGIKAIVNVRF